MYKNYKQLFLNNIHWWMQFVISCIKVHFNLLKYILYDKLLSITNVHEYILCKNNIDKIFKN